MHTKINYSQNWGAESEKGAFQLPAPWYLEEGVPRAEGQCPGQHSWQRCCELLRSVGEDVVPARGEDRVTAALFVGDTYASISEEKGLGDYDESMWVHRL